MVVQSVQALFRQLHYGSVRFSPYFTLEESLFFLFDSRWRDHRGLSRKVALPYVPIFLEAPSQEELARVHQLLIS